MAGPQNVSPVRGMRDLLPEECALRDWAAAEILEVYRRHGFARIETPVLEHLELLTGGQGGENEKLLFKVLKRGEELERARAAIAVAAPATGPRAGPAPGSDGDGSWAEALADAGLRFDLTVPLARFHAAHAGQLPSPFKAIQIGPVFRAERPQKGRYRQFTQCDIDVLGEAGPIAEIELVVATTEALAALGLSGFHVRINDRRLLRALARSAGVPDEARQDTFFIALDKLDKLGPDGVVKELSERGFGEVTGRAVRELAAQVAAGPVEAAAFARSVGAQAEAEALLTVLDVATGVLVDRARLVFDPTLVRGMGYYTGPIFEVGVEGLPYSVAGGGRYDRMIGRISGRDVPACGFSIGFERVVDLLAERGSRPRAASVRLALLWDPASDGLRRVIAEADQLRRQGNAVAVLEKRRKLGKQLFELQAAGYDGAATLPEDNRPPEIRWFEAK